MFKVVPKSILLLALMLCASFAAAQRSDNYLPTNSTTVELDATNLPIVFLNVNGNTIQRDSRITAWCKIIDNGEGNLNYGDTIAHPEQTVDYEGYVGLRYRGNTSYDNSDKKPYSFRPFDGPVESGGKKKKAKIMGMAKDNDWAMLAPFADKSMIRDVLTFELARPFFDFVPHSRFCELILDGTYYGVYIMCELVTKGNNRLDLNDPGDDDGDLTGDYLVEIDRPEDYYYVSKYYPCDADGNAVTSRQVVYQYKSPEYEDFADLPEGTLSALQSEIDKMEDSFAADDYDDPDTGYRQYIDEVSFMDYFLATELAFNIDGYRLSTKLYKYSNARHESEGLDPRWKTSLWDFNIAYGNANYFYGYLTNLWQYKFNDRNSSSEEYLMPFWWSKMMSDTAFVSQLKNRWQEYRAGSYSDERLFATIDSLTTLLTSGGAVDRNQEAWANIGVYEWPNYYIGSTYDDEIDYLTDWIESRLSFMDRYLLPADYDDTEPVAVKSGWNADIVVESLPAASHCTEAVDITRTFYSESVKADGGLPDDRAIVTTDGTKFTLSPYDGNNAMFLQEPSGGDIVFEEPFATSTLFMLATNTQGDATVQLSLRYDDGTFSDTEICTIQNWSVSSPLGSEAITSLGNVTLEGDEYSSDNHYCLFEIPIWANKYKNIEAVAVTSLSTGRPAVLAFSRGVSSTTGINGAPTAKTERTLTGIYTIGGVKISAPQRGINIMRYSDGTSRKVLIR